MMRRDSTVDEGHAGRARRMTRLGAGALLSGVLTIGLVACGSSTASSGSGTSSGTSTSAGNSGGPTKTVYVAKANAICKGANDQLTSTGSTLPHDGDATKATPSDLPAWSQGLQQVNSVGQSVLSRLRALGSPAGDEATVSAFLAKQSTALADLVKAQAAAAAGDLGAFRSSMVSAVSDGSAADQAESAYGLTACGGSS